MRHSPLAVSATAPDRRGFCRRFGPSFALLMAALTVAAHPARAGMTLNASTAFDGGINVNANYSSGSTSFGVSTAAGRFTTTWSASNPTSPFGAPNSSFLSYCVDIATYLDPGQVRTAQVSSDTVTVADTKGVVRDIQAAGWVFNSFATKTVAQLQAAFSPLGLGSLTQAEANAAMQLSIWEASYDTLGGSSSALGFLGDGALRFTGAAVGNGNVLALVNAMLQARLNDPTGRSAIGFIDYPPNGVATTPDNQDQLFGVAVAPVPEPSTMAMAATGGLVGLVMLCRRRRKGPAPRS